MKKVIALLLVCTMIFTLCACGGKKKSTGEKVETAEFIIGAVDMGKPENELDVAAALQSVTYVPQMFYGSYETEDYWTVKSVTEGIDYTDAEDGKIIIDYIPDQINAGPTSVYDDISFCDKYNIMSLCYKTNESGIGKTLFAAYEVDGNKLKLTFVKSYTFDQFTLTADVVLSDFKLEYTFSFEGNTITLSDGTHTKVFKDMTRVGLNVISIEGYLDDDSPDVPSDDFYGLYCNAFIGGCEIGSKADSDCKLRISSYENKELASATYSTDGIFTLARKDPATGKVTTKQYLAFLCGYDGLVLCEGEKTYCYTKSYKQIAIEELSANLAPEHIAVLKQMDEFDLEEIVKTRNQLFTELETELGKQGVKAIVNRSNGEIALDSTVLFATGESTLSDEGKAFLKKFVTAYSNVVLKEEYNGFLSKVMIEGHTDSTGTDEVNKPLSKARADAVLEYCTSAESGLTAAQIGTIKNLLGTFGYAAERPVLKADGTEDADASRRVGFRFIINIDTSKIETTTEA